MNKKRQASYLLLLLSIIAVTGGLSFGHAQGLSQAAGLVPKASASTASNQSGTNGLSSFLPPALTKSVINEVRNTNATSFAFHNAFKATSSALNKTAGTNATSAAGGINKTAGTKAVSAAAGKINSTLNLVKNTNATKFAANNIINATKNNATQLPSRNTTSSP